MFQGTEWRSERVMSQTRMRLGAANLAWREVDTSWDVERPDDCDRCERVDARSGRVESPFARPRAPTYGPMITTGLPRH